MIDANLVFDGTISTVAQGGVTGSAITATRVSTNVLDLLVARDLGVDEYLGLHVDILQTFLTLTSLTIDFEVGATAGGTYYNILSTPAIPVAQLIAGAPVFKYAVPWNQVLNATAGVISAPGRFLRLNYTVAGSNATAGTVFSYLNPAPDRQSSYTYPNNYTAVTVL